MSKRLLFFTYMKRQHSRAFLILVLTLKVSTASSATADQLTESFREGRYDQVGLGSVGKSGSLTPGVDGLEIKISPPDTGNAGIQMPRQLNGDFVITADVELLEVPTPKSGFGTGVAILLEDGERYGASLQRVVMPDDTEVYVAHHYVVKNGVYEHHAEIFETKAKQVQLQVERKGRELFYRAAEDGGATFRDLHSTGFTGNSIRVTQLYGQTGGAANAVSVLLKGFTIEAEELLRPGQRSKLQDQRKFLLIGAVAAAVGACATTTVCDLACDASSPPPQAATRRHTANARALRP